MDFITPFKKHLPKILIAAAAVTAILLSYLRVFELYELQTYDWRCKLRGDRPVHQDIVFIDIWDDTLKALGAWPFSRTYHADLIRVLHEAGAKAVGFDMLFVEGTADDADVAQAAREAGNTYFVYAFLSPERRGDHFASDMMLAPLVPEFAAASKGTGYVNAKADLDGKRRRTFPTIHHEGKEYYQLSFRLALDLLGVPEEQAKVRRGVMDLGGKRRVPLDDEGYFLVNYAGKWEGKNFKHYSYYDVLAAYLETVSGQTPRIDLKELRGKICFVGLTALGSHDTNPIPIQSIYPMVGLYANVLNNILLEDYIRRADRLVNTLVTMTIALGTVLFSLRMRPVAGLLTSLGAVTIYALVAVALFLWAGIWIDLFYPVLLVLLSYAVSTLGRTMLEMRKRELIEKELKIASQIQQSFLPQSVPSVAGAEVAVFFKPAKAVGGDLYTFLTLADGKLGVMVGDVSGKGTPAALFMAKAVSEFKFCARDRNDPAEVLSALNDSISSESTGGLFVTMSYAIFDVASGTLSFSNGGHLPVVQVAADGTSQLLSAEEGMPIGVMPGMPFAAFSGRMTAGDCYAFYSDGVTEARNRRKDEWGVETLQKIMSKHHTEGAGAILERSVEELKKFMGKAEQHDDITLIVVKVGAA
ncbi:MAG: hypothetical protein MOGMAGMI_00721 [Candidatus Omnitrophica bacterium]|nr:hypothetical protein [Candidatus Omnitrophota bacterium]